ncbi:hypothetical protein N7505_008494 [Penicillium chrysogenum]|jgi:hypothetical protein|uniref:Cell wall protein n=1 Tax=Penicillium chrysogenum TaxID=5076 RepID=A0ABQ8WCT2_PENCH|nr:hypothetical protein N7505_008494 [Penicillium chrysogenum]KAJ5278418.1 hypothetical protein N7524_004571 [Penicillium chrysogenum]
MVKATLSTAASLLMLAKTAFGACETHSFTSCADNIVHWYDPTNGVVCDPLDCGGGRAPVKYDVPCCAAYRGTEPCVSTTSTLSCWSPSTVAASSTSASASPAETTSASVIATADTTVPSSTGPSSTAASSTGVAGESSTHSSDTTAPSTTEPPTQSTDSETSEAGTASSSGSALPVSTNIAGGYSGSLMAVAGAAIGAVIFV